MAPGSPGPFKRYLHWLHGFGAHWGSPCGKGTGRGAEVSPHHWRPAGSPWMGCGEVVFLGRLHPPCACPQDSGSAWLQGGTVGSAEGEQAGLVGRGACPRPLPSLARCAWSHLGRRLCPERRCWGPAFPYEVQVAGGEQRPGASVESAPASGAFRSLQHLHGRAHHSGICGACPAASPYSCWGRRRRRRGGSTSPAAAPALWPRWQVFSHLICIFFYYFFGFALSTVIKKQFTFL